MSNIEERLEHTEKLVRGLSEQTSGNITIINSNCQMLGNRLEALEKKVQDLETKTASNLSQPVVAESETSEDQSDGYVPTVDDFFYTPEKDNSEKPNNQEFDKERALELLQDIESSSTKNSNASTKAILLSCAELREMLGAE